MKTKYSYKQIWTISYPILISLIMEQMIGMTDTAFLGRVGEIELGASAIAGVYYLAIFMMAFGFSIGAQILIARRNGEGNYKEIGPIFYQGIYFLLAMAVILFTFSIVFSPYILKNIISSPHIYDAAESYIHWRVYGFFFSFIMVMFRAFFVGTTQTKTLTLNSIVMVLSNVVFNYILIFGKFGFPQLGIAGAAIGSSLAEMVSVIFFIIYTWKRIDCRKYALNILPKFQGKTLKRILNVSVWTMIQNFVSLSTWFMFFLFVEHLGERSLAIANIIRNVSGIPFMIAMAFASTCGSLVSNLIGAGEQDCTGYYQAAHSHWIYICIANSDILLSISGSDPTYLYRYAGFESSIRAFTVGIVFCLSGAGACQCLFPIGIRYREYADCTGYGTLCIGYLRHILCIFHHVPADGRRICLDNGMRIWYFHADVLLLVYEERKLAEKEDLNPFFTIFARK